MNFNDLTKHRDSERGRGMLGMPMAALLRGRLPVSADKQRKKCLPYKSRPEDYVLALYRRMEAEEAARERLKSP